MFYVNSVSVKHLKFAPKWPISYFEPTLVAIFVTIATAKVKIIRDLYTLAFVLINLEEEICENTLLEDQKGPFVHVALYNPLLKPLYWKWIRPIDGGGEFH